MIWKVWKSVKVKKQAEGQHTEDGKWGKGEDRLNKNVGMRDRLAGKA